MKKSIFIIGAVFFIVCFFGQNAYPHAFELYDQGRAAQAQGGAFTAQADDPTAVYYNPAAIPSLEGTQVLVGTNIIWLNTKYISPEGASEKDENDPCFVPAAYVTTDFGLEKWGFGLGAYSNFGLKDSYSPTGMLRYYGTETELKTIFINPVISYQITDTLSIGAGISYVDATYEHNRKVDFGSLAGMPGLADGDYHMSADADGWGWNIGLFFQPAEKHAFGIIYRSKVDLDFSGNESISNIPSFASPIPEVSTGASASFELPDILRAGYAYHPIPEWKIEVDLELTFFDSFKTLMIESSDPAVIPDEEQIYNWDNSWTIAVGTQYQINDSWILRAGYAHVKAAAPESTYSVNIPDADRNFFTIGAGYTWNTVTINGVFQYSIFNDVEVTSSPNAPPGKYETDAVAFGLEAKVIF